MKTFWMVLTAAMLAAGPADAAPVVAAIGAISGLFTTVFGAVLGPILFRLGASLLLTSLAQSLRGKPRSPGIKTEFTTTGGSKPVSFVLGTYATSGHHAAPPYSHGVSGGTPNAFLTFVISLSDLPGASLKRIIMDDDYVTLSSTEHADYGFEVEGKYNGYCWVKYYDGSQTVADPMLISKYGAHETRPWRPDMVGTGVCYAIVTFRYNRELFNGLPRMRFEMGSIPVYDPRKDSTVGGSGTHRWSDRATWEPTENLQLMNYNVLRGIPVPDGSVWGGDAALEDVPLSNWFAAMNECDVDVSEAGDPYEAQYWGGLEIDVDEQPSDIMGEFLKGCSGQIVEMGGTFKTRTGGPGLPVYWYTDDGVVVSTERNFKPFPGLANTHNAVHASYPDPDNLWESKDAPARYSAALELEDQGRRLPATINLSSVPRPLQVQRLMEAWVREERRFRRHNLTLPPSAAALEPLDSVAWSSSINGYDEKVFEIGELVDDLRTANQNVAIRERNATDYDPSTFVPLPWTNPNPTTPRPAIQGVSGWNVTPSSILDGNSTQRRPALMLHWTGTNQDGISAIRWEVRIQATNIIVSRGSSVDVSAGEALVSEGILPGETYQVRAKFVTARRAEWTVWKTVTAANIRISEVDIAVSVTQSIANAQAAADDATSDALQAIDDAQDVQDALDLAAASLALDISTVDLRVDGNYSAIVSEQGQRAAGDNANALLVSGLRTSIARTDGVIDYPEMTDDNFGEWRSWPNSAISTRAPNAVFDSGKTWTFDIADTDSAGVYTKSIYGIWSGQANADAYIVTVDFTLESGDLSGSGLLFDWVNGAATIYRDTVQLSSMVSGPVVYGQRVTARVLAQRPVGFAGTFDHNVCFLMANYSPIGNRATKVLKVHGVKVRVATQEELASGVIAADLSALTALTSITQSALTTLEGTVAAGVGIAATTVDVNGTAHIAEIRLTSGADPDGSGGSAVKVSAKNILLEGTVSTDMMIVGLGRQMMKNANWSNGLQGWTSSKGPAGDHNGEISAGLRPAGSTYAGVQYETYMLQQLGVSTDSPGADLYYYSEIVEGNIVYGEPVGANQWVEASVNVSSLNCSCELYLRWIDADTLTTGWTLVASSGPTDLSPDNPENWLRLWGKAQTPIGTAYVGWLLRKKPTSSGGSSWLFAHKPQLALTHEHSEQPTPWSAGGTTLVSSEGIRTGAVTADKIDVDELAAITATLGTFQTATSGERVVISDDKFVVYDDSNIVRVKLGDLS